MKYRDTPTKSDVLFGISSILIISSIVAKFMVRNYDASNTYTLCVMWFLALSIIASIQEAKTESK